ncbi:MAG: SRPBCC family protein [Actinomycetota bacterium]
MSAEPDNVAVVDQGFVRAPRERVYELVRDPDRYPNWWPAVAARAAKVGFPLLGEVSCRVEVVKDGIEIVVRVEGSRATGHLLWYLETFKDGTIAYVVTNVTTARRWSARRVLRHRTSMRVGLLALARALE